jgi:hypothetical protein
VLTMCQALAESPAKDTCKDLARFIDTYPSVECLYVLDMKGNQISETLCNPARLNSSKRFLYEPASEGADHSLKEYFLPIQAGLEKFTTRPYISLASGNLCTTISHVFYHKGTGRHRILCVDMKREEKTSCSW